MVKLVDSDCTAKLEGSDTIRLQGQQLGPAGMENPTMNPQLIGKPYQYVYGAGLFEQGFYSNSVGKMDVRSLQVQLYKRSPKDYPGEPVFVPRPDGDSEDDGVLISQVLTTDETRNNYLAVLDAKTLQELAIIEFDRKLIQLPPSIHGVWQWPATISDYPQKSEL